MWPAHMPRATTRRRGGADIDEHHRDRDGDAAAPERDHSGACRCLAERLGVRPRLCTDRRRRRAGRVEDSGGLGGRNRAVRSRRRPGRQGVGDRNLVCFRTGQPRRRGRGSSGSPAPLRGREANARPRPAGLPGPAGRCRAAGPGRARAGPDRGLERHPHHRRPQLRHPRLQQRRRHRAMQQHLRPLRRQLHLRLHRLQHHRALRPLQRTARIHRRRRPHHHHPRRPHPRGRQHVPRPQRGHRQRHRQVDL